MSEPQDDHGQVLEHCAIRYNRVEGTVAIALRPHMVAALEAMGGADYLRRMVQPVIWHAQEVARRARPAGPEDGLDG